MLTKYIKKPTLESGGTSALYIYGAWCLKVKWSSLRPRKEFPWIDFLHTSLQLSRCPFHCISIYLILVLIHLLTAIGLTPDGSSTVHIYTQTIYRTTQLTTLVRRLSGIRTQVGQTKINLLAPELFFFLILAHPVYKMWIILEPNTLELWNILHFEEEKTESIYHV